MNDEQRKSIEIWRRDAMGMATGGIKKANQRIIELADLLLTPSTPPTRGRECCEATREAAARRVEEMPALHDGDAEHFADVADDIRSMLLPAPPESTPPPASPSELRPWHGGTDLRVPSSEPERMTSEESD